MFRLMRTAALLVATALLTGGLAGCQPDDPVSSHDTPISDAPRTQAVITGTVRDAARRPIAGAAVQPRSLDQPAHAIPEIAITTDDQGRYSWTLPPGEYSLEVKQDARAAAPRNVSVGAGETATVDFTLR